MDSGVRAEGGDEGEGTGRRGGEGQLQPGCKINYFLRKDFYLMNIGNEILATVKVGMDFST